MHDFAITHAMQEISEGMQKLLIPSPHKHSSSKESLVIGVPSPSLEEAVHEPEDAPSEDFEELNIEPDASKATTPLLQQTRVYSFYSIYTKSSSLCPLLLMYWPWTYFACNWSARLNDSK